MTKISPLFNSPAYLGANGTERLELVQEALQDCPDDSLLIRNCARLLVYKNRSANARQLIEQKIEDFPSLKNDLDVQLVYISVLKRCKDPAAIVCLIKSQFNSNLMWRNNAQMQATYVDALMDIRAKPPYDGITHAIIALKQHPSLAESFLFSHTLVRACCRVDKPSLASKILFTSLDLFTQIEDQQQEGVKKHLIAATTEVMHSALYCDRLETVDKLLLPLASSPIHDLSALALRWAYGTSHQNSHDILMAYTRAHPQSDDQICMAISFALTEPEDALQDLKQGALPNVKNAIHIAMKLKENPSAVLQDIAPKTIKPRFSTPRSPYLIQKHA